jgi:hypothetical protein
VAQSEPALEQVYALSSAIQSLPEFEPSAHFLDKVMAAVGQEEDNKIIPIHSVRQQKVVGIRRYFRQARSRAMQVAAGFVLFGLAATLTFKVIGNGSPTTVVDEQGPVDIVQTEYHSEDFLLMDQESLDSLDSFIEENNTETYDDELSSLDTLVEDDYSQILIGGQI